MNPRADDGTIVQASLKNVIISDKEVINRIAKISASAFELLKKQLEEKRNALLSEIKSAESLESKSHFYSTKLLRLKLAENHRTALHNQSLENPLEYFRQKCLKDYDEILKKIEQEYDNIKAKVKVNLEINTLVAESMHQLETPLNQRINKLKADLIETLQNVAVEYREHLISTKEWAKKIREFTDKFGCVAPTYGALQPEIDKSAGYGLQFGHIIRDKGDLPRKPPFSIDEIKKMKLEDIEKMINQVIQECLFKPYANDAYIVHEKIRKHFENLAKKRPRDNYEETKDFEFQEQGTFYRYLSSFKIIKKEHELFDIPMSFHRQKQATEEREQDQDVAEEIKAVLKNLQSSVDRFKSIIDGDIALVNGECKRTIGFFDEKAKALYNDIKSCHIKMEFFNSDAKAMRLAIDTSTHKVQLAYENAMKAAKVLDEASFQKQSEVALEQLAIANDKKRELDKNIEKLEKNELAIGEKLKSAETQFQGAVHKVFQAKYGREVLKFAKLKTDAAISKQYIEDANQLPKAIQIYGDFTFDYARSRFSIKDALQYFEKIPASIHATWISFNKMIADAQAKINFRFQDYQKSALQQIAFTNELLKNGNENLEKAKGFQVSAEQKLNVAKTQFPVKIHVEHQENFDVVQMELIDAYKKCDGEARNFDIIKLIPDAIKDYSEILYKTSLMRDEASEVDRSGVAITTLKNELDEIKKNAEKSRKFGIIHTFFENAAKLKLEKTKEIFEKTAASLKMAETIMLSEQKMLGVAKRTYPHEMHKMPQELFDSACSKYSSAKTSYDTAEKDLKISEDLYNKVCQEIKLAAVVEKEKQLATNLRQLLLETILFHLDVWPGKWGGGVDFRFMGKVHRIPHGILELITALNSSADHKVWMANVIKVASDRHELGRSSLKYFFKIRNDSTAALYRVIKNNLKLDESSLGLLTREFKTIPGLRAEEKSVRLAQVR